MIEKTVTLHPEIALHARPAARFVQAARKYSSKITVEKDGKSASAISPIALIGIDAGKGATVVIKADGADEAEALDELASILTAGPA